MTASKQNTPAVECPGPAEESRGGWASDSRRAGQSNARHPKRGRGQERGCELAGEVFPEEVQLQLSCKGVENILSKKSKSCTRSRSDNWRAKKKKKRKKKCVNDMLKPWACCLLQRGIHFLQETGRDRIPASPSRADSFDWPLAPTGKRKLPRAAERCKTCLQRPPFEIPRSSDTLAMWLPRRTTADTYQMKSGCLLPGASSLFAFFVEDTEWLYRVTTFHLSPLLTVLRVFTLKQVCNYIVKKIMHGHTIGKGKMDWRKIY